MGVPETIQVKFSEDMAQYADIRPVRRQPMKFEELVGLVLTHTGKDRERIREVLHHGTCSYNIYKYWWEALDPEYTQLEVALDTFPDPEPGRTFDPAFCLWARFSDAAEPRPHQIILEREEAASRRWFVRESLWTVLLRFAAARQPGYVDYSYYDKADIYGVELDAARRGELLDAIRQFAPRALRGRLARAAEFTRLDLACGRP
jgi:hypothetical protein